MRSTLNVAACIEIATAAEANIINSFFMLYFFNRE